MIIAWRAEDQSNSIFFSLDDAYETLTKRQEPLTYHSSSRNTYIMVPSTVSFWFWSIQRWRCDQ